MSGPGPTPTSPAGGLALGGLLLVAACGNGEPASGPDASRFELVEVERLGSVDGALTLDRPVAVREEAGRTLILEGSPARLVQVAGDGSVQELARAGTGPGELVGPLEMGRRGGEIWIADGGGRRVEVLDSTGRSLDRIQFTVPPDSGGLAGFPRAALRDGNVLVGPGSTPITPVARGSVTHDTWYLARPDGTVLDTIYRRVQPSTDFFMARLGEERFVVGAHPLMERPLPAAFPDGSGLAVVERWAATGPGVDTFRILVWDHRGRARDAIAVPYEPVPAEGWRERRRAELESDAAEDRPELVDALVEAPSPRSHHPPVSDFRIGQDGRLLLRREEAGPGPVRWEIYGRGGVREGSLELPASSTLLSTVDGGAWVLERDALDVPYLVKYALRTPD